VAFGFSGRGCPSLAGGLPKLLVLALADEAASEGRQSRHPSTVISFPKYQGFESLPLDCIPPLQVGAGIAGRE